MREEEEILRKIRELEACRNSHPEGDYKWESDQSYIDALAWVLEERKGGSIMNRGDRGIDGYEL